MPDFQLKQTSTELQTLLDTASTNNDKIAQLENIVNLPNIYGVEKDITTATTELVRIGAVSAHVNLPIQSLIRRCILRNDGTVNYYLDANNSALKEDGTAAILDGTDGQLMVEIPAYYIRFDNVGNTIRCLMSLYNFGGAMYLKKAYCSAVEATIDRTNNMLASVINTTAQYRGGNNDAAIDSLSKTQLGKPATAQSLTSFRTLAKARGTGWAQYTYEIHWRLFWLFAVEYANFNCQLPYNSAKTAAGYSQGGLGDGLTTLDGSKWSSFNGYYPVANCGLTASLGNKTGEVSYNMPVEYDAVVKTVKVNSFRGIENPFGHIWKWADGCKVRVQDSTNVNNVSEFFVCKDPAKFQDTNYADYEKRGNMVRAEGYIKTIIGGEFGCMIPATVGGGSTTYFGDYTYLNIPASGESQRGVLFGGGSHNGSYAGFGCSNAHGAPSAAGANVGSRLCYLGA